MFFKINLPTIFKENNESIKTKFEAENNNNIQGFKYIRGDLSVGEKIILSLDCLYALNSFTNYLILALRVLRHSLKKIVL